MRRQHVSMIRRLISRGLHIFFERLYHDLAWAYDGFSAFVSVGQWRTWQRAALPYLGGRRVLEIGHGTGDMLLNLVEHDFEPIGLDLSPTMGPIARQKLRRHGYVLAAPLVRGSAEALPIASAVLPAILVTFPPTDLIMNRIVLGEIRRVLLLGGQLVLVPTVQITGQGVLDRLATWLFEVTGQSAPWLQPATNRLTAAGFLVKVELVWLDRSRVIVVVATKTEGALNL